MIKIFKYKGVKACLDKEKGFYELTISYRKKYYLKKFQSKEELWKVIKFSEQEVRDFIKQRSLFNKIKNYFKNGTSKRQENTSSAEKRISAGADKIS